MRTIKTKLNLKPYTEEQNNVLRRAEERKYKAEQDTMRRDREIIEAKKEQRRKDEKRINAMLRARTQ